MAQFETNVPTTELEAVNTILSVIGQGKITQSELTTPTGDDTQAAIDIVRDNMREVLSWGWQFNTEWQFRIAVDGSDKFAVPADLLKFEVSKRSDQQGFRPEKDVDGTVPRTNLLDIVVQGSFFYDRLRNTNVWGAGDFLRAQIFIDIVRTVDFEDMPETARRYVTMRTARQFAKRMLGDKEIVDFTADDELVAFRNLKRDQGDVKRYSLFDSHSVRRVLGGRPRYR